MDGCRVVCWGCVGGGVLGMGGCRVMWVCGVGLVRVVGWVGGWW